MESLGREPEPTSSTLESVLSNFSGMVRQVGWRHRLSEADIDELMQDVRIRLWRAQSDGDAQGEKISHVPASYIYRTATTAALDIIRRRRSGRNVSHDEVGDVIGTGESVIDFSMISAANPERDIAASELAEQVGRAIETIPASRRAVVRMYLAGYPREEIAELMGWTEAKTRNLLYRGLSDLRERLAEWGIRPEEE
jgi:RNA polymerase sigma factor (sigma-70 family)